MATRRRRTVSTKQQQRIERLVSRMAGEPTTKATRPMRAKALMTEIGASGLRHDAGYLQEEFRRDLQGVNGSRLYREMVENSAKIAGALFAIEQIIRRVEWRAEPSADDRVPEAQRVEMAEFVDTALQDMSQPWSVVMSEILTMLPQGFAPLEIVYKRRGGPSEDPSQHSRYSDGKIGWRKLALRGQDTICKWELSDDGGLVGLWQQAPPSYQEVFIPVEKFLLFRPKVHRGNPEGHSLLRPAYSDYYFAKKLTEIAAIGAERNLTGLPICYVPAESLSAEKSSAEADMVTAMQKIIERVRNDEQSGLVFPRDYAKDAEGKPVPGAPLYEFALVASPGGTKADEILKLIEHHERKMLIAMLADFLVVGHEQVGARAVAEPKMQLFGDAISGWLDMIGDVFNRVAIPRLGALNGWRPEGLPELRHGDVSDQDATMLSELLKTLSDAGLDVFPDEDLTRHVYSLAKLPIEGRERMEQEDELETRGRIREQEEREREAQEEAARQRAEALNRPPHPPPPAESQADGAEA